MTMHRYTRLVLGVILCTGLQGGCAPAPTPDPLAEVRRVADTMTHDMAQSSSDMGEILCGLHGAEAAETVRKRDVLGVTLPEALASLAKVAHAHPDDPNVLALNEVFRQYTAQVYAHPAWTQAAAWAYAKQECFRAKQVSDQQIERQSTCRMPGVIAEVIAKERDTERT